MKHLIRVLVAVVVGVVLFVTVQTFTSPTPVEGEKQINIKIVISETQEVIYQESVNTDAVYLSELLEELAAQDYFTLTFSGSKNDAYGRFLLGINEHITQDVSVGPWWMVYSDNNQDCVSAGYCLGVDMALIYDLDEFVLEFSN